METTKDHEKGEGAGPIRVRRRLAAILVADVVGYSRLMRADESATITRFRRLRDELAEPRLVAFGGRLVKSTGDGFLAEFGSAVDAVQCAVDIQRELLRLNDDGPADARMELRIGINVGDVVVEDDDLFGDGVNVASRLEGIAQPGGICISATVYDQVHDKLDLVFEDRGLREVKNIVEPVRTFSIDPHASAGDGRARARSLIGELPSIAVLPFDNMSGDAEQDYFSDGITEDIITDLSKLSSLMVIARNSSFTYKGRAVDVKQVARELGVRHVLEGSVRRAGNRVRINAQLIDGRTGGHVWAERYDRVLEDIFAIQDEITLNIVQALKIHLDLHEKDRLSGRPAQNMEAYDLVLRGRDLINRVNRERFAEATAMFERAIALDPRLTFAYSGLAFANILAYVNDWTSDPQATIDRAHRLALDAIERGPEDALAHRALAVTLLWKRDMDGAAEALDIATRLSPNDSETLITRGNMLVYLHRPQEAIEHLERARRLSPRVTEMLLHFLGHAHFMTGDYDTAAAYLRERIEKHPETDVSRVLLASCYGHLGRIDEARRLWEETLRINPAYSLEQKNRILPYKDPSDWERFVEGLSRAGLPR